MSPAAARMVVAGILVLPVDRRDQLIEIAFAHSRDAQEQCADHLFGHDAGEARQAMPLEHRLQFVRRTGQQHADGARFFEPLAGGGAAIVGEDLGALDHEGLALVDFGHVAFGGGEALREPVARSPGRNSVCGRAPAPRHRGSRRLRWGRGRRRGSRSPERPTDWRTWAASRSRSSPMTHLVTTSTPSLFSSAVR